MWEDNPPAAQAELRREENTPSNATKYEPSLLEELPKQAVALLWTPQIPSQEFSNDQLISKKEPNLSVKWIFFKKNTSFPLESL